MSFKSNFSDKIADYKDIHGFATMITIWRKIQLLEIQLFFSWKFFGYLVKSKQTLQFDDFFTSSRIDLNSSTRARIFLALDSSMASMLKLEDSSSSLRSTLAAFLQVAMKAR